MRLIDHVRMEDPQFPTGIPCIVTDEIARQLDELPGDTASWRHYMVPQDSQ